MTDTSNPQASPSKEGLNRTNFPINIWQYSQQLAKESRRLHILLTHLVAGTPRALQREPPLTSDLKGEVTSLIHSIHSHNQYIAQQLQLPVRPAVTPPPPSDKLERDPPPVTEEPSNG